MQPAAPAAAGGGGEEAEVAGLRGNFFAIEMLADVGRRAGMGERLVRADEAAGKLRAFLHEWTASAARRQRMHREGGAASGSCGGDVESGGGGQAWRGSWKDVVAGTSALQMVRLLDLLHPTHSHVFFSRHFTLGPEHVLKPGWTLGAYVSHVELSQQREQLANKQR